MWVDIDEGTFSSTLLNSISLEVQVDFSFIQLCNKGIVNGMLEHKLGHLRIIVYSSCAYVETYDGIDNHFEL